MRPRTFILALLATVAIPTMSMAADHTGFQLQADGLFVSPSGTLPSQAGANLSDLFGSAKGFDVVASTGITRHLFLAVRAGEFQTSDKSSAFGFNSLLPGHAVISTPYDLHRTLTAVPVHALVQYRHAFPSHATVYVEAGAGVISFTGKLKLRYSTYGQLFEIAGYQREPSWTAGAGFSAPIHFGNLDLVAGGHYDGTMTGDGAVFAKNDDPKFVSATVGLRYPSVTH